MARVSCANFLPCCLTPKSGLWIIRATCFEGIFMFPKVGYSLLSVFVLFACGLQAETQAWRSVKGSSVQAEFVRLSGSSVVLKREDGTTINVAMSALDEASQSQAKRLAGDTAEASPAGTAQPKAVPEEKKLTLSSMSRSKASGVPTDEEIRQFLTEYKETPTSDEAYEFEASFAVPSLTPDEVRAYGRKKKIPYRLTVTLYRTKVINGQKRYARMDGTGNFIVLSEAGDVVDRQREALGKLCPS